MNSQLEAAFTPEAWVNPEMSDGENRVANKDDVYEIAVVNGTFQTAVQPEGWAWMDSLEFAPDGEWTHVATTWDGSVVNTFVNGAFISSFDLAGGAVHDSPEALKVGRRTRGGDTHSIFTSLIDEVRLSKVVCALSGCICANVTDERFQRRFQTTNLPRSLHVAVKPIREGAGGKAVPIAEVSVFRPFPSVASWPALLVQRRRETNNEA